MVQNTTIELGVYRYVLRHAKARETLHVSARIGGVGAALFQGLAQGRGGERLANAIAYMLQSPDLGPTLDFVVTTFAPYTQVIDTTSGTSVSLNDCLDVHFAGRMGDFAKWIETAVEFECGDFLGELGRKLAAYLVAKAPESSASTSPQTAATSG